jgi:hypothetical protein
VRQRHQDWLIPQKVGNGCRVKELPRSLLLMEDPGGSDPHVVGDAGPQLDPRRMFTRAEVWRAWELQGQTCNLCRRAIPFDLMHGDHIIAWSAGGATTFDNLQALCGSCQGMVSRQLRVRC